jgi:hypothetical protein
MNAMPRPGTTRTVTHSGWTHTQVALEDGTWWNIRVERATAAR